MPTEKKIIYNQRMMQCLKHYFQEENQGLTDYLEIIIIEIPNVLKTYTKTPNDEVLQ